MMLAKPTVADLSRQLRLCEAQYQYQVKVNIELRKKYEQLAARLMDVLTKLNREKENGNAGTTH